MGEYDDYDDYDSREGCDEGRIDAAPIQGLLERLLIGLLEDPSERAFLLRMDIEQTMPEAGLYWPEWYRFARELPAQPLPCSPSPAS